MDQDSVDISSSLASLPPPRYEFYTAGEVSEVYVNAYRLGYLSPRGLMPLDPLHFPNLYDSLDSVIRGAAVAHDSSLYTCMLHLVEFCRKWSLPIKRDATTEWEYNFLLQSLAGDSLRIQCGLWDSFSVEQLDEHIEFIHAIDVVRARQMGIVIGDRDLGKIFSRTCEKETSFALWTDAELRICANIDYFNEYDFQPNLGWAIRRLRALPWLLRRQLVLEDSIEIWMIQALYTMSKVPSPAVLSVCRRAFSLLCDVILQHGWQHALTASSVRCATDCPCDILVSVLRLCPQTVREEVFDLPENYGVSGDFVHHLLWGAVKVGESVVVRLDAMHAEGMYQHMSMHDVNTLVLWLISSTGEDDEKSAERVAMLAWVLTHLPFPSSPRILTNLAHSDDGERESYLPSFLPKHRHLPWRPLDIVLNRSDVRGEVDLEHLDFIDTLAAHGYCLPRVIDAPDVGLNDELCLTWRAIFKRFEKCPPQQRACSFTADFLKQARLVDAGVKLLKYLSGKGYNLNPHSCCHAQRDELPASNSDADR